jgi:ribosomal protein L37AE/L43A
MTPAQKIREEVGKIRKCPYCDILKLARMTLLLLDACEECHEQISDGYNVKTVASIALEAAAKEISDE